MANICDDVTKTIGHAPLVRINRLAAGFPGYIVEPENLLPFARHWRAVPLDVALSGIYDLGWATGRLKLLIKPASEI